MARWICTTWRCALQKSRFYYLITYFHCSMTIKGDNIVTAQHLVHCEWDYVVISIFHDMCISLFQYNSLKKTSQENLTHVFVIIIFHFKKHLFICLQYGILQEEFMTCSLCPFYNKMQEVNHCYGDLLWFWFLLNKRKTQQWIWIFTLLDYIIYIV